MAAFLHDLLPTGVSDFMFFAFLGLILLSFLFLFNGNLIKAGLSFTLVAGLILGILYVQTHKGFPQTLLLELSRRGIHLQSFLPEALNSGGAEVLLLCLLGAILLCFLFLFKGDVIKTLISFILTVGLIASVLYVRMYENIFKGFFDSFR